MNGKKLFKGGPVTMRQGGIGPDDYLFRKLPRGRWTYVIIRHKPEDGGREAYDQDRESLSIIHHNNERVCMPDLQNILWKKTTQQERNSLAKGINLRGCSVEVVSASKFLERALEG